MNFESLAALMKVDSVKTAMSAAAGIIATIESGPDGAIAYNTVEMLKSALPSPVSSLLLNTSHTSDSPLLPLPHRRHGLNKVLEKWCVAKGVAYNAFKIANKQVSEPALLSPSALCDTT